MDLVLQLDQAAPPTGACRSPAGGTRSGRPGSAARCRRSASRRPYSPTSRGRGAENWWPNQRPKLSFWVCRAASSKRPQKLLRLTSRTGLALASGAMPQWPKTRSTSPPIWRMKATAPVAAGANTPGPAILARSSPSPWPGWLFVPRPAGRINSAVDAALPLPRHRECPKAISNARRCGGGRVWSLEERPDPAGDPAVSTPGPIASVASLMRRL